MNQNASVSWDKFELRHIGPRDSEVQEMLKSLGKDTLDSLIDCTVPRSILTREKLKIPQAASEHEALRELRRFAEMNQIYKTYIGMGYHDTVVPSVIKRNILESPGWYTQYTPYQAEISQGRLEALLNFQTMVADLTGLPLANASLLDEATAAAEAMTMAFSLKGSDKKNEFLISEECHPQTIAVVKTRAKPLGIQVRVTDHREKRKWNPSAQTFGALLQYPTTTGAVEDYADFSQALHQVDALVCVAADLLSLVLLKAPGEWGADIAVGNTQRFGVPLGFGGPHAAFFATRDEFKRRMPGRLVGVSKDSRGKKAYRLTLQTREQHIRRDKATSNICTAQVLLAIMASMYAVYHGPQGLKDIAERIHYWTVLLARALRKQGYEVGPGAVFDTLVVSTTRERIQRILEDAKKAKMNLRALGTRAVGISLHEATTLADLCDILSVFGSHGITPDSFEKRIADIRKEQGFEIPDHLMRRTPFMTHPVFHQHRSETQMLRYIKKLESRDLSLAKSMIALGSCTMKLNATTELIPVSWPKFGQVHPFAPLEQAQGYVEMIRQLEFMLCEITGFKGVSLQPNAGSQGEYAGLLVIEKYHQDRGEAHRKVCLIPRSAHGTNPASAAMVGMQVVVVDCDSNGNIDLGDLRAKAQEHTKDLACLMVTYPSTHGVFEEEIREICTIVHEHGGQVYMDGANMNAQIGLCRPAEFGADVCHLNLHKTFSIPHGGGGPGMGPIGVAAHLVPYLPGHPLVAVGGEKSVGAVSAAPWGSPSILPVSWSYIRMMGGEGLKKASEVAILNANYVALRLNDHYPVLYRGAKGFVAHECIIDLRDLKAKSGVDVEDVAKRLMDYGFHAPTVSFPVPGTMMIEPTESESKAEMDRFCDALISIRREIEDVAAGKISLEDSPLKNAPHTADQVCSSEWTRKYSREAAAFPAPDCREWKFWPAVSRIDNLYGDRNVMCTCPSPEDYR